MPTSKMTNHKCAACAITLILPIILISCGPKPEIKNQSTPSPTQEVSSTETATAIPDHTLTPSFTPTTAPTPTALQPTETPIPIQFPLPDLLLNVNNWAGRIDCDDGDFGEVWLTEYPYTSKKVLLANSGIGYFYPTWSLDGNWIAYVASQVNKATSSDLLGIQYEGSDTVWIMRPDGSQKRQVGKVARIDYQQADNSCFTIEKIDTLLWSPDGKYLIFIDDAGLVGGGQIAYILEVATGETYQLARDIFVPPIFSPDGHDLAILGKEIQLIAMDANLFIRTFYPRSSEMPEEFNILNFAWEANGEALLVSGYDRSLSEPEMEVSIWRLEIQKERWKKIAELGNRDTFSLINPIAGRPRVVKCGIIYGPLALLDPTTREEKGVVEGPEADCDSITWLKDSAGSDVVIFVDTQNGIPDIWAARVGEGNSIAQKIAEGSHLGFDSYAITFSPRP
jgi:hypothetical protein